MKQLIVYTLVMFCAVSLNATVALADPLPLAPTLETSMLEGHNTARNLVGQGPLVWSNALAIGAASCAAQLAQTEVFEHCEGSNGWSGNGENLWMGTRTAYSYAQMVGAWVNERTLRRKSDRRDVFHEATGHYDQVVWPDTRQVGCAIRSSRSWTYLVCEYFPAGNVFEE